MLSKYAAASPLRRKIARDKRLGQISDTELAELYGCSQAIVSKVRASLGIECLRKRLWNEKIEQIKQDGRFGTIADCDIAKDYDVSTHTIREVRQSLGIGPFIPPPPPRKTFFDAIAGQPDLATATRQEIADRVGCSIKTVTKVKQDLGIAPPPRKTKPESPISKYFNGWNRPSGMDEFHRERA